VTNEVIQPWSESEAVLFTERTAGLATLGLGADAAEAFAERLLQRDRDLDDRRSCLECKNLGRGRTWFCREWAAAGVALQAGNAFLAKDWVRALQRCTAFTERHQECGTGAGGQTLQEGGAA
jgi:hypothetical protein